VFFSRKGFRRKIDANPVSEITSSAVNIMSRQKVIAKGASPRHRDMKKLFSLGVV
jgi:hypothetical protein